MTSHHRHITICLLLAVSFMAAFTATANTAPRKKKTGPKTEWIDKVHDFGAFDESLGRVTCLFRAVNTGDEPLVVVSARANCGCTRPQYPTHPIAPGDTLTVSVAYDALGRPGRFEKKVYIVTNTEEQSTLSIRGTVIGTSNSLRGRYPVEIGSIRLATTVMPFGEIKKGRTGKHTMKAYNASHDSITPVVSGTPAYIKTIVEPATVGPGEQFVIFATFDSGRCPVWGIVNDSIRVSDGRGASSAVNTVAIVKEDFSTMKDEDRNKAPQATLSRTTLDFGRFGRTAQPLHMTFTITNTGQSPLIVRRLHTPDKAVTATISSTTIKSGKEATVKVTADPALIADGELLNARITLITNAPSAPSQTVRVVGEPTATP
ncbi:DUF1573 domain-containing protein [Paramuribaculum intestinale]|uniref:DUF1573 domain-containing protein n=1 Tax=Paramuribaculum intestinale TaxID=2094151 RepID=UPI00272B10CB|nr:DUF1573 domain-containing protein [Paramuribaculum intestinale]